MQNTAFSTNKTLNVRGRLMSVAEPKVMGILNVTPDSFYDGGRLSSIDAILSKAEQMLEQGAAFLDIGGYSTRPGAAEITITEELERVVPAVSSICKKFPDAIISVDTFRSEVARRAVEAGASMINDVSGGNLDLDMFNTVAELKVPYVLMHMRGNPQTMISLAQYQHLLKEIMVELQEKLASLLALGISNIIIDPGFGFAKTREQNFQLLENLPLLAALRQPIMVGVSRKSMIWKTLGIAPDDALNGTAVLNTVALLKGANILRVHDVKEAVQAVQLLGHLSKISKA